MVSKFERQLPDEALQYLQTMPDWWRHVLNASYRNAEGEERRLLIALRSGYLNAYADGQSVLRFGVRGTGTNARLRGAIHRKYVLGPEAGHGYLVVDETQVGGMPFDERNLQRWINAALGYAGEEKRGVAAIAARHPNTIDVEMGLPANEQLAVGAKKVAPRMDLVALERAGEGVRLAFYEVKQFSNPELRAENLNPKVLDQLRTYEDYASNPVRRQQIIGAYRNACRILRAIAEMRGAAVGSLVHKVANNPGLHLDLDPKPRLIVFGYDASHSSHKDWLRHETALRDRGHTLLMGERAEDVQLPACLGK